MRKFAVHAPPLVGGTNPKDALYETRKGRGLALSKAMPQALRCEDSKFKIPKLHPFMGPVNPKS